MTKEEYERIEAEVLELLDAHSHSDETLHSALVWFVDAERRGAVLEYLADLHAQTREKGL